MVQSRKSKIKSIVTIAVLISLSVVLSLFDKLISSGIISLFPFIALFIPSFKLGIANIVILIIIYNYKFGTSLLSIILKSVILGLFSGYIALIIGFSGTILSFIAMYFLSRLLKGEKMIVFVSAIGGFTHSLGQIIAGFIINGFITLENIKEAGIELVIIYSPLMLVLGVVTGIIVGLIAYRINKIIKKNGLIKSEVKSVKKELIYVGHRGGKIFGGVENTKEAFLGGVKASCQALECDIHLTSDNKFIIFHDATMTRLTQNSACQYDLDVNETSYDELKDIELSQVYGDKTHYGKICLFEDYLEICRLHHLIPVVELKATHGIYSNNEDPLQNDFSKIDYLMDVIKNAGLYDQVCIISSMNECLKYIRNKHPKVSLQQLFVKPFEDKIDDLVKNKIDVDAQYKLITKEIVEKCHQKGLTVNVWTVNTVEEVNQCIEMGVDMITSDYVAPINHEIK